jgi:hypothetical protein
MTTTRLEAFSDGVFGIAIMLLVLEIGVFENTDHLVHDLGALWPSYLGYAIRFLVIGLIWGSFALNARTAAGRLAAVTPRYPCLPVSSYFRLFLPCRRRVFTAQVACIAWFWSRFCPVA